MPRLPMTRTSRGCCRKTDRKIQRSVLPDELSNVQRRVGSKSSCRFIVKFKYGQKISFRSWVWTRSDLISMRSLFDRGRTWDLCPHDCQRISFGIDSRTRCSVGWSELLSFWAIYFMLSPEIDSLLGRINALLLISLPHLAPGI